MMIKCSPDQNLHLLWSQEAELPLEALRWTAPVSAESRQVRLRLVSYEEVFIDTALLTHTSCNP